MELVAGPINKCWLDNLVSKYTPECTEVRAAIAYAARDNLALLDACKALNKPLTYWGRYDETVPVSPEIIRWFLDQKSAMFTCRMVPDILHAKVIWWVGVGAYIGSANLTRRAWTSNIEAGTFISDEEMERTEMIEDIRGFFDVVDQHSQAITDEFYKHLLSLGRLGAAADKAAMELKQKAPRFFPMEPGLASVDKAAAADRGFAEFARRWRESLQVLRDISGVVSLDANRPPWIPDDTPVGAQADQFVHAYYYKFIGGHRGGDRVAAAFKENYGNQKAALATALAWWKEGDFDHTQEQRMLLKWAPRLKQLFAKEKIRSLTKEEFIEALSMVHAVIDYGKKRANVELGLPESQQDADTKVALHAAQLWEARTAKGKTPLEVLDYVIWGPGDVEARVWAAARSSDWRLPWVKYSTLGEIVGWARPDEYPPRNDRTLKGLTALGYPVRDV